MRKLFIRGLFVILCGAITVPVSAQSMSDAQVLEYVKQGLSEGKDQRVLATELARRGVTEEQARRVKQLYDQQNNAASDQISGTAKAEARLREQVSDESTAMMESRERPQDVARENQVYGRNIFNTRNLTFEPSVNIPTPLNYRLGAGDEVIIDIWGASQNTIRQQISPEGTINIGELGPLYLSGMTMEQAQKFLTKELRKIYSDANNQIRVTLGNTRTIQINVMGEVVQPGTYALSAFSTGSSISVSLSAMPSFAPADEIALSTTSSTRFCCVSSSLSTGISSQSIFTCSLYPSRIPFLKSTAFFCAS